MLPGKKSKPLAFKNTKGFQYENAIGSLQSYLHLPVAC